MIEMLTFVERKNEFPQTNIKKFSRKNNEKSDRK